MIKRNILFLLPSLKGGGAERTLINALNKFDFMKYSIDLCLISKNGIFLDQIPDYINIIGIFKSDYLARVLSFIQRKYGFKMMHKLLINNKIRHKPYDVAISFLDGNYTDLLFLFINAKKRISWIHSSYKTFENFAKRFENESYRKKLIKSRYSKLDALVFVSHDSMNEFISIFGKYPDMRVIYNIINPTNVFLKSSECIEYKKGANRQFITLGRYIEVKGFDRLIRSAKIVKDAGFSFTIKIVGQGPLKSKLTQLIKDNDLENEVILMDFQINPYPLLKISDVFIMSSISEALPTALCEAMILGKPVLVTNCSGCREVVNNGEYGLMVEQDDHSLAEGIIKFIESDYLIEKFSKKSIERSTIFDDQKNLEKYYNILNL